MNQKTKDWVMNLISDRILKHEDELGFYTNPSEKEIISHHREIKKLTKLAEIIDGQKSKVSASYKKWAVNYFSEEIEGINNFDYMDDQVSTYDRLVVLEHLDYSRQMKKVAMSWK